MSTFVLNSVSLNLLSPNSEGFRIIDRNPVINTDMMSEAIPAIGHETTAAVIQRQYGISSPLFARVTINLCPGDKALVFQYSGPRLPEGATVLPEGAKLTPILVEVFGQEKVLVSRKAAEAARYSFKESAKGNAWWSVGTDQYERELADALGQPKK